MRVNSEMLTYFPFLLGSLLFIFIGGVLLLSPDKFTAAGRWWGKKIGFPGAQSQWNADRSFKWRNWRLPGLYVLCFGLFLLLVTLRSLTKQGAAILVSPGTFPIANKHQAQWPAFALDAIVITLGIFILLRTEQIVARFKNARHDQANADDRLNYPRYLFKAIGFLAIVVGLVFLLRHVFSL